MADKLDRLTKKLQQALMLSQEEAVRLQQAQIGTEHLLLGLVRTKNNALEVLTKLGVSSSDVVQTIDYFSVPATNPSPKPTLGKQAKRAIEYMVDEARIMNFHHIVPEHLLLGLLQQEEGPHMQVFNHLKVDTTTLRTELLHRMLQAVAEQLQSAKTKKNEGDALDVQDHLEHLSQIRNGIVGRLPNT